MKKFLFLILILFVSIMITPFSMQSYAENSNNSIEFETYYPKNVLEYSNLEDDSQSKFTNRLLDDIKEKLKRCE